MLSITTSIRVRYQETDKMGIAYHGNYFTWMEVARIHLLDSIGCPYKDLEENGYFLPVIRCECDFKIPARFDDIVEIEVRLPKVEQLRINLDYTLSEGNSLLARAKTSHVFVGTDGKAIRPPGQFIKSTLSQV